MMKTHNQWLFEAPIVSSEHQQWPVYLNFEDELEGSVSSVLYEDRGPLSRGQEALIIRQAIQAGIRDENELTNRVFSARYPKRKGRMTKSDPNFRQLSQECLSIRNNLVRPALQSAPSRQPTLTPTATPTLLDTKSQPEGTTLYVKIPLGGEKPAQPMTGIFIPSSYRINSQVDLIIYLHGYHTDDVVEGKASVRGCYPSKSLPSNKYCYPSNLTINQYWNKATYPFFALREGVNASGKNAILIAPTLGPLSQTGNLVNPGGFDAYLDQVMASLSAYGPYQGRQFPRVSNIILACHSGGGLPMRKIALSKERYAANIRECWGFDCTYNSGDAAGWSNWVKADPPSRKVYIYYIRQCLLQDPTQPRKKWKAARCPSSPSGCAKNPKTPMAGGIECTGTTFEAMKLACFKLPNICVGVSKTGDHNKVPITYWEDRIKESPSLS